MKLLDLMIQNHSFHEFVRETITSRNEEQEEKAIWDMWLHKVFDQSFADFRSKLMTDSQAPNQKDVEQTVKASFGMLDGFVPDEVLENDRIVSAAGDSGD